MIAAHIAGLPFEEWLGPVVAAGGSLAFVVRAALHRVRPERRSR
jgi:hypothetical protein